MADDSVPVRIEIKVLFLYFYYDFSDTISCVFFYRTSHISRFVFYKIFHFVLYFTLFRSTSALCAHGLLAFCFVHIFLT